MEGLSVETKVRDQNYQILLFNFQCTLVTKLHPVLQFQALLRNLPTHNSIASSIKLFLQSAFSDIAFSVFIKGCNV
jgi:hypothetical protein